MDLTLEGEVFARAPAPLTLFADVILGRVRPPILHNAPIGGPAPTLFAETLSDLLDTEALGFMRCRFQAPRANDWADNPVADCEHCPPESCVCSEAAFVNRSMLACPVPRLDAVGAVTVDISVYKGASYSTSHNG